MTYFARPVEGLRQLPSRSNEHGVYLQQLLEWRRREIDNVHARLLKELQLEGAQRERADQVIVKLPVLGLLLLPDWIEELIRLRRLKWLLLWRDMKLPPRWVMDPVADAGPAQPWHLGMINKPAMLSGTGVTIGVIDSGYDPTFGDLQGTFAPAFAQYVDPPPNSPAMGSMVAGGAASDSSSVHHGSKVCVMLAGSTSGVAPQANVLVAAINGIGVGSTRAMMALAIEWLMQQPTGANADRPIGCDIISTSIATSGIGSTDQGAALGDSFKDLELFNTLVVAAIGNREPGLDGYRAPATGPTVIGVGAVDSTRTVANFSAYGLTPDGLNKPDIVAPGSEVHFPLAGGGHEVDSGTSYAAPIVAGAAALILEKTPGLRINVALFRYTVLGFASAANQVNAGDNGKGVIDLTNL
jgi:subtilisin family serine protease